MGAGFIVSKCDIAPLTCQVPSLHICASNYTNDGGASAGEHDLQFENYCGKLKDHHHKEEERVQGITQSIINTAHQTQVLLAQLIQNNKIKSQDFNMNNMCQM
jgi:hypothetical protein